MQSANDSGAPRELDGARQRRELDEVPTLFGAATARPRVRVADRRAGRDVYVQFGDGDAARACRPARTTCAPVPQGPRRGRQRQRGALAQLRPAARREGREQPDRAEGGVDPERRTRRAASIPLGVRTLGRAVSLLDYEDFARAFTGVAKAKARSCRCAPGRRSSSPSRATTGDASPPDRCGDDLRPACAARRPPRRRELLAYEARRSGSR